MTFWSDRPQEFSGLGSANLDVQRGVSEHVVVTYAAEVTNALSI